MIAVGDSGYAIDVDDRFYRYGDSTVDYIDNDLRDISAWYHIVISAPAIETEGTVYINGVEYPQAFVKFLAESGVVTIGQFTDGRFSLDGYMSELYMIDGQALDASSFGKFEMVSGLLENI